MKKSLFLLLLSGLLVLVACSSNNKEDVKKDEDEVVEEKEEKEPDKEENSEILYPDEKEVTEPTYVDGIMIVNKKFALPKSFNPEEDPEAKASLLNLLEEAQKEGYDISDYYSGFRPYEIQVELYNNYKNLHGESEADTFSARPGYSEHQTGLTFDLFHQDGAFLERDPEAKWVAENAHRFGFIVRYQKGKEEITGYQAEPWHLRYIGEKAEEIYRSELTLEEYLKVAGGDYIKK